MLGSFSYHPEYHRRALDLLERGQVDPDAIVTHAFPLGEADQAFRTVADGEALKVMVMVGNEASEGAA